MQTRTLAIGSLVAGSLAAGGYIVYQLLSGIDDELWRRVIEAVIPEEGGQIPGAYWRINPDDNGHGISFGIIQFNQGVGGLPALLRKARSENSGAFDAIMEGQSATLLNVLSAGTEAGRLSINLAAPPWSTRLQRLGQQPWFQVLERAEAVRQYGGAALSSAMAIAGLDGPAGAALVFDRSVQFGPGTLVAIAKNAIAAGGGIEAWIRAAANFYPDQAGYVAGRQRNVLARILRST